MDDDTKICLQRQRVFLVKHIVMNTLLPDYLVQDGILTCGERDLIMRARDKEAQGRALLDKLSHCKGKAFGSFVNALNKTNQAHVAEKLRVELDNIEMEEELYSKYELWNHGLIDLNVH